MTALLPASPPRRNAALPQQQPKLRVVEGLHQGLPGYWYPVLPSRHLGATQQGLRRFGQELVLWRDSAGRPVIFEDRCPHRAARLSVGRGERGKIQGDTLSCWYHGWRFDTTGTCVSIPTQNVCELPPERTRIRRYHAAERAGLIWMYYGPLVDAPPPLQVPPELEDPRWHGYRTPVEWPTNWLNIMDNLADPMHQYTLHGRSYITQRRPPFNRVRIAEESDERLRLVQYLQGDDGQVITEERFGFELRLPNWLTVDLPNAAPGGDVRVVMLMTPIDEANTFVHYWRGRRVSGFKRLQWQVVWHLFYRRAVYRIAHQDETMLGSFGPLSATRSREHLVASDVGVIRLRRLLNRAFARSAHADEQSGRLRGGNGAVRANLRDQ